MPSRIGFGGRIPLNNVRALREERHWTQQTLADQIGTTPTSISRIERCQQGITLEVERRFLAAFSVTEDELYAEPTEIVEDDDSAELLDLWRGATPDQKPRIIRAVKGFLGKD